MKILLVITILLAPFCLQADVYKWTDEQGIVHYGDEPLSRNVEQIQIDSISGSPDLNKESREEKRQRVSDLLETDRLAKKEAREKSREEEKWKREDCNRLKDTQRRFKKAGSLYDLNKKGERVTLSAEQRRKSEQRLQQRIRKTCR